MFFKEKAFTLVELLIVIAIIAILSVAFLPNVLNAPKKARDVVRVKNVANIAGAVEVYYNEKGKFPSNGLDLTTGTSEVGEFCFNDTAALATGMEINNLKDKQLLNSCNDVNNKDLYFYRMNNATGFYLIGAKLETGASANAYGSSANSYQLVTGAGTAVVITQTGNFGISSYLPAKGQSPTSSFNVPWFIAVGPS